MKTVPHQKAGAKSNSDYQLQFRTSSEAKHRYQKAKENLLQVNRWKEIAGLGSAGFQVVDNLGNDVNSIAKEGNYLRISIPIIPGSAAVDGDDWVFVEMIEEKQDEGHEYISMKVRPAVPPHQKEKEVTHFFDPHATSTFSIERKGRVVRASVIGRNEKPNTDTNHIGSRVRNFFIAIGAMLGLNKPQWKSLVKGLVNKTL
jgi:hypothetical protein